MWTERKDNFSQPRSSSPGGAPPDFVPESASVVSDVTMIAKNMAIRGSVKSNESLHLEGEVDGSLELPDHRLTIGTHGRVGADVKAREVEVFGRLDGDIDAVKKIIIRKGGRVIGDLRTPAIVIEDGAYFKGRIEIVNADQRPQIVRPTVKKTAAGA